MRSQYFSYGRQVELSLIAIHNDTDGVGGQYQHSSGLTLYYADAKITSLSKFNSITGKWKHFILCYTLYGFNGNSQYKSDLFNNQFKLRHTMFQ